MKISTYIPGFTLLELIFSLSISGVVLILGFTIYQHFQSYAQHWQTGIESTCSFAVLNSQLKKDLSQSNEWELSENELWLWSEVQEVQYLKRELCIIRQNRHRQDTFSFQGNLSQANEMLVLHDTLLDIESYLSVPLSREAKPKL